MVADLELSALLHASPRRSPNSSSINTVHPAPLRRDLVGRKGGCEHPCPYAWLFLWHYKQYPHHTLLKRKFLHAWARSTWNFIIGFFMASQGQDRIWLLHMSKQMEGRSHFGASCRRSRKKRAAVWLMFNTFLLHWVSLWNGGEFRKYLIHRIVLYVNLNQTLSLKNFRVFVG